MLQGGKMKKIIFEFLLFLLWLTLGILGIISHERKVLTIGAFGISILSALNLTFIIKEYITNRKLQKRG